MHELADTVPSRTERIRVTSGTTSAGLAIGITNVSRPGRQDHGVEETLTDSIVALQGVTQLMGIVVSATVRPGVPRPCAVPADRTSSF